MFGGDTNSLSLTGTTLTIVDAATGASSSVDLTQALANWSLFPAENIVNALGGVNAFNLTVGNIAGGDPAFVVSNNGDETRLNSNKELLVLAVENNPHVVISNTGKVGVGTYPDSVTQLKVQGAVQATGALTAASLATAGTLNVSGETFFTGNIHTTRPIFFPAINSWEQG
jgi:hypothetical protein